MRVWIDQDLCTGDGLCNDHCPEVFTLLDDGISYVRDLSTGIVDSDPGGRASIVAVPRTPRTSRDRRRYGLPGRVHLHRGGRRLPHTVHTHR